MRFFSWSCRESQADIGKVARFRDWLLSEVALDEELDRTEKPRAVSMSLIVFAHGAGAGPESDFMQAILAKLEEKGHKVHTFAFPYWQKSAREW